MGQFVNTFNSIALAIKSKDGGSDMTPAQMALRISDLPIETPYSWDARRLELDWPDIKAILDADSESYAGKMIELIDANTSTVVLNGGVKYKTSEGQTYTTSTTVTWDPTKDIVCSTGLHVRWVIGYFNSSLINNKHFGMHNNLLWTYAPKGTVLRYSSWYHQSYNKLVRFDADIDANKLPGSFCANYAPLESIRSDITNFSCNRFFAGCYRLRHITGSVTLPENALTCDASLMFYDCQTLESVDLTFNISAATNTNSMFMSCIKLKHIDPSLYVPNTLNASLMFNGCQNLEEVPPLLTVPLATNTAGMFASCYKLKSIPDTFSVLNSTACNSMFLNCLSLSALPDNFRIPNATNLYSFLAYCYNLSSIPRDLFTSISANNVTNIGACVRGCEVIGEYDIDFSSPALSGNLTFGYMVGRWPVRLSLPYASGLTDLPGPVSPYTPKYANVTCNLTIDVRSVLEEYACYFADFDESGNLKADCMVSSLPTVTSKTLTLQQATNTLKAFFTTEQKTTILTTLNNKGWTLAW